MGEASLPWPGVLGSTVFLVDPLMDILAIKSHENALGCPLLAQDLIRLKVHTSRTEPETAERGILCAWARRLPVSGETQDFQVAWKKKQEKWV